MYFLLVFISLIILVCSERPKHYILKYPTDSKAHDAVGATYQSITKRHYSGATTAEILNTITSPHSSSSVSFTTTSVDHHPEYAYPLREHSTTVAPPSHNYELQNIIVNDQEHAVYDTQLPTYTYRFAPNQTAGYQTTPRVSPKAFSYQPVITLSNNMKTFYKVNKYAPFVVPPSQYYADLYANNYISNSVYPTNADLYKSYPSKAYAESVPAKLVFPSPVVSYNVSAYPTLPPSEGFSLAGVPKPYRDNAYLEPERPQYRPVLILNKYAS